MITFSNEQFKFKPRFNKTSAEPTFPLALLFPCFAIFTPQDAATNATAVEILNVLAPSPPVPQVSTKYKFGLATGNSQTFKSSSAIELSSTPVELFALKALKKAPVSTSEISSLSHLCIKDLEVNSSRSLPSNKLFRISAFDRLEDIYLWKKIIQIKFNLKYQNLSQLNLYLY